VKKKRKKNEKKKGRKYTNTSGAMLVSWVFFLGRCFLASLFRKNLLIFSLFFFLGYEDKQIPNLLQTTLLRVKKTDRRVDPNQLSQPAIITVFPPSRYQVYTRIMLYEDIMINRSRCVWVCVRQKVYFIMNIFV